MRLFVAVALILGMASPVLAGGAFDSYMQGSSWMSQMLTNDEMQKTMQQQRELQQRQIEEMDAKKQQTDATSESVQRGLAKINSFIEARPEYRDNAILRGCLLAVANGFLTNEELRGIDLNIILLMADQELKKTILAEADRIRAKK